MLINKSSNLADLAECMGPAASKSDARPFLAALLAAGYEGKDSSEIPDGEWHRIMLEALDPQ